MFVSKLGLSFNPLMEAFGFLVNKTHFFGGICSWNEPRSWVIESTPPKTNITNGTFQPFESMFFLRFKRWFPLSCEFFFGRVSKSYDQLLRWNIIQSLRWGEFSKYEVSLCGGSPQSHGSRFLRFVLMVHFYSKHLGLFVEQVDGTMEHGPQTPISADEKR